MNAKQLVLGLALVGTLAVPAAAACTQHYVTTVYRDGVMLDGTDPVRLTGSTDGWQDGDVALRCGTTYLNLSLKQRIGETLDTLILLNALR